MEKQGRERRRAERVGVHLKARWRSATREIDGEITDLSETGCFILTADEVEAGEAIKLEIEQPRQGRLHLLGEVVYKIEEMGFAVNFTGADEADLKQLRWLIKAEAYRNKKRV